VDFYNIIITTETNHLLLLVKKHEIYFEPTLYFELINDLMCF